MIPFLLLFLLCGSAAHAAPASPNLLANGGFEILSPTGNMPVGWQAADSPAACAADQQIFHTGNAAYRLAVPADAPVSWYSAYRAVSPLRRGATYTFSAWVRTQDVRDAAGAYISLNCFDGEGKRLAAYDSPRKLTGSSEWQLLTTTGAAPDGTAVMRAILCVNGHGTAWFDDAQVEESATATPYQPAAADTVLLAQRAAEERAAAAWRRQLPPRKPGQARIAILDLTAGGATFPRGASAPSDPAVLARAFASGGYLPVRVSADQLASTAFLAPEQFDLLVIPTGDAFPAAAHAALVSYLRRGGALLTTGGYAFDRPLARFQGKWYTPDTLPIATGPRTPLPFFNGASLSALGWQTHSSKPTGPDILPAQGPQGMAGVKIHTDSLEGWATALSPRVAGKLLADWSVTRFWAKGDGQTPKLAVEWHERDGSRWKKVVPLTTEWREYVIPAVDFNYWHDNPSVGRGGAGDHFHPENADRMLFGVATDIATPWQAHTMWVAGAQVQADPAAALRVMPRINTRWARIRDAMWPEPEQIGAFDPSFPLRQVARALPAPGQDVVTRFSLTAPLSGYAATAMLGLNGHGFGPNRARWIPLLECQDRFGRERGHAGAIIHHFSGTFAGSSWAIFGVNNRDLFAANSPALRQVLLPVTANLLRHLYLHETDTAWSCYRQGEAVQLRTRVSNFGHAPRTVTVRFQITPEGAAAPVATLSRALLIPTGETASVELPWQPARFASDYYTITAVLLADGKQIDREENAFVVWDPAIIARGPKLTREGTRFLLDGRPQFLMGCQTYWGQNGSVTARSPKTFARDFRQMRDYGLRWTRCFIPFRTEEEKRESDAIVQLAQKYGIVLYHTPNLYNTADPALLAEQEKVSQEIATRYRGVPGMAVDICNEPEFTADDPALQRRFGRAGHADGVWTNSETSAFWNCMEQAQRAWADGNCRAVHAGDPERMASVGWSQGWGGGDRMKDPLLASLDLDFTDRHYYGQPARMPEELKDLDLRGLGKPLILGECGAKDHPTFKLADPWFNGDDDAAYDRRFLSLGHHALGLGAAAISSWHWRDPMEGIFPCGIMHQTGAPRPTGLLYRAMALAFSSFKPLPAAPKTVLLLPDAGRLNGQRQQVIRAFHRATALLVSLGADFTVLPDSALDRLPAGTKAILYPLPLNPSDTVVTRLEAFVANGGALYLSGDLRYDENGLLNRRERLPELCGVEAVGKMADDPLQTPPMAGMLVPAKGSGLLAGETHPLLLLKLAGAEMLAGVNDTPVVTRYQCVKGQVWFSADPVELAGAAADAHRALYRAFLQAAGTPGVTLTPDHPERHAFRVPGEDADAIVLFNGGPAADVTVGEYTLHLAASGGAGFLLLGHDGALRAAEAQGAVRRKGAVIAELGGHAFLVARDNQDLTRSRDLLALPLQPGEIRVRHTTPAKLQASLVEQANGRWHSLSPARATLSGGFLRLPITAAENREILQVSLR